MINRVLISTTFDIAGYRVVAHKGLVRGLVVRSPTIAQGFMGGLKSIVGGTNASYTEMCEQTRDLACQAIEKHALALGANAIIGFRYDATEVGVANSSATEVLCYGTAVTVELSR